MSEAKPTARRQCSTCASELGFTEGDPCDNCVTAKPTALLPPEQIRVHSSVLFQTDEDGEPFTAEYISTEEEDGSGFVVEYTRAHSPAQAEWLPIESAPKYPEGATPMLVYGAKRLEWAVAHRDVDDSWLVETCSDRINIYPPTHWIPLPQPPKEQQ